MPSYKTIAIVLKRRNQGESDRVLTLFSPDIGHFSAIAKGSRKQKSKLAGRIELFTEANFVLTTGRSFEIITEAEPVRHFSDSEDMARIGLAHFASEIILKLIPDRQVVENVYDDLKFILETHTIDPKILEIYFVARLLYQLGIYPELSACLVCREKPKSTILFSNTSGGIYCKECKPTGAGGFEISKDTVKLWRFLQTANHNQIERLNIEPTELSGLRKILRSYLTTVTSHEYRSFPFID